MLEESAAQLAALRQRAEYLLDQLSAGNDGAPPRPDTTEPFEDRSRPAPDYAGNNINHDQKTVSQSEDLPPIIPLEYSTSEPPASDGNPADLEPVDRPSDPPAQGQSHPQPYPPGSLDTAPYSYSSGNLPRAAEPSVEADAAFPHPDPEAEPRAEAQPRDFPIQTYQEQPSSLLDAPIGAALPLFWRPPNSGPEGTSDDVQLIEEEIVSLYEAIDHVRETRRENTGHALSLLREAREIISAEPQRIERAQYNIQQAKQIIDRARFSRSRSRGIAFRTIGLLIIWLSGLGGLGAALYLYPLEVNDIISVVASSTGWNTTHYYPALWTVATGGIGGCLGTISFLFERMRVHEEFDHQYIVRSTIQPLMGIVLGLVSYVLLAILFASLGAPITSHPITSYLPAALALPMGIWQVYVYAAIFRLTRLLTFQRRRRW